MENKTKEVWILIGQLVGLRKAIHEAEKRLNYLKGNKPIMTWFGDDSVDEYCLKYDGMLEEAEAAYQALGSKYGSIKGYFRKNFYDHQDDLKKELFIVEQGFKGNNPKYNKELTGKVEELSKFITIQRYTQEISDDYKKGMIKNPKLSSKYYEQDLKKRIFKEKENVFNEINTYLKLNFKKTISYETFPRKAEDMVRELSKLNNTIKELNTFPEA